MTRASRRSIRCIAKPERLPLLSLHNSFLAVSLLCCMLYISDRHNGEQEAVMLMWGRGGPNLHGNSIQDPLEHASTPWEPREAVRRMPRYGLSVCTQ